MSEDYCELCDLPKSQCIHGNPPPPPPARATARATPVRRTSAARTTGVGTGRSTPSGRSAGSPTPPAPPKRHRWTPPDAFAPHIVAVLEAHGGEMEQDDLFDALEERMSERLTDADRERTPEGELRWRYAARRARQGLLTDGRMTKGRPGVWALA
jgi:hypothetical protein